MFRPSLKSHERVQNVRGLVLPHVFNHMNIFWRLKMLCGSLMFHFLDSPENHDPSKKNQQINQIIGWSLEDFFLNLQILIFSFPFNTLGRWVKIDSHQVPVSHFEHFIFKLQVQVNSIRETSHKAQPLYSSRTRRVSYKIFNPERLYLSL